jgi:cytochrome P450
MIRLLLTAAIAAVTYFLWKLYKARLLFYRLQTKGVVWTPNGLWLMSDVMLTFLQPMPPWNPIFGHLAIMPQYLKQIPIGASQPYMLGMISKNFPQSDYLYYLDLWPFSGPMIVISTPEMSYQMVQVQDLQKPASLVPFFKPITGGLGIAVMNGEELKASRALFNPGFASNVILEQTSAIIEEAKVYVELLREHAEKGDMFLLDDLTCWYMMDVIGKVTLCVIAFGPLHAILHY